MINSANYEKNKTDHMNKFKSNSTNFSQNYLDICLSLKPKNKKSVLNRMKIKQLSDSISFVKSSKNQSDFFTKNKKANQKSCSFVKSIISIDKENLFKNNFVENLQNLEKSLLIKTKTSRINGDYLDKRNSIGGISRNKEEILGKNENNSFKTFHKNSISGLGFIYIRKNPRRSYVSNRNNHTLNILHNNSNCKINEEVFKDFVHYIVDDNINIRMKNNHQETNDFFNCLIKHLDTEVHCPTKSSFISVKTAENICNIILEKEFDRQLSIKNQMSDEINLVKEKNIQNEGKYKLLQEKYSVEALKNKEIIAENEKLKEKKLELEKKVSQLESTNVCIINEKKDLINKYNYGINDLKEITHKYKEKINNFHINH